MKNKCLNKTLWTVSKSRNCNINAFFYSWLRPGSIFSTFIGFLRYGCTIYKTKKILSSRYVVLLIKYSYLLKHWWNMNMIWRWYVVLLIKYSYLLKHWWNMNMIWRWYVVLLIKYSYLLKHWWNINMIWRWYVVLLIKYSYLLKHWWNTNMIWRWCHIIITEWHQSYNCLSPNRFS